MKDAAISYLDRGWVPLALGPDANGKPKRPLISAWQTTTLTTALDQPWSQATGIGILLGSVSGNLAVIDMDNQEFAAAVKAEFEKAGAPHYWVQTGSGNGHLYVVEDQPSDPKMMRLEWGGASFSLELRSHGQQVAAPPSPGYTLLTEDLTSVPSIGAAWQSIARRMGIGVVADAKVARSGYPKAWQRLVDLGDRNNALFIESCRLCEAGLPLESAIETMLVRSERAYKGTMQEREVVATVRSAYRKAAPKRRGGVPI